MPPRTGPFRVALATFSGVVFAFLLLPLLVVFPLSLSSAEFLQFPPPGWSLRWFEAFLGSPSWIEATLRSIGIGLATATLASLLGIPAAFFLVRTPSRAFAAVFDKILVAPMIVPPVVIAVVAYGLFSRMQLIGSWWILTAAHTVLALPLVVVVVTAGLREFDRSLENAALGLGAGRIEAFFLIVFPIIRPSVVSGFFFAFMTSFDDLIVAIFLAGGNMTLPKKMFENISFALDPTIAAVCVLQILCLVVGGAIWRGLLWRQRSRRIRVSAAAGTMP